MLFSTEDKTSVSVLSVPFWGSSRGPTFIRKPLMLRVLTKPLTWLPNLSHMSSADPKPGACWHYPPTDQHGIQEHAAFREKGSASVN